VLLGEVVVGAGVVDVVHLAVVVLGAGVEVSACNKKVKAW
jgi:hypothetical protein